MEMETNKHNRFPISGFARFNTNIDLVYLFWKNGRWKPPKTPEFDNIPEEGLPVKKIFVDKATGRLIIKYETGVEEE